MNNTNQPTKKKQYIPGIECCVTNCAYNDTNHNCFAQKINVGGPSQAKKTDETKCDTFQSKQTGAQL